MAARLISETIGRLISPMRLAAAIFLLSVGVVAGILAQRAHVPRRLVDAIDNMVGEPAPRRSAWTNVSSNRHQLQIASVRVWDPSIKGGSLAQMGDFIVFASPQGRLLYLDAADNLHAIQGDVRMNIEAARNDPLYRDTRFDVRALRTHDLLAIRTGEDTYNLYASFDRFSSRCVDFVIAQRRFRVTSDGISPIGRWRDLWSARPCLRWRDRGPLLSQPSMAGGRMERLNADEILVTVGDRHHDGYYDSEQLAMNTDVDYGKLVAVNMTTGAARHYAIGVRNPLGLAIDRQGRIWETENGPQGGDEINLIEEGANYGWPIVTYGMNYGAPPRNWPFNPTFGGHEGFQQPSVAFVPSIGIGNLFLADPNEFPHWTDSLLVTSLRAQSLHIVKLEGDRVMYVEPIPLNYRVRDAISLADGRLALLTDEHGLLLLVRNAERNHPDDPPPSAAASPLPPLAHEESLIDANVSPVSEGRAYFVSQCSGCHSVSGEMGVGPPLNGVVGRDIASVTGFGYSAALTNQSGVWTETQLEAFIDRPQEFAPGTAMPSTALPIPWANRIVAYLKTERTAETQ